jgi:cytochrome c556
MKYAGLAAVVAVTMAIGATAVVAQSDPIAERQKILKGMGAAVKDSGNMLKGAEPFDAAKVKAALEVVAADAAKLPTLFPEGSGTGKTAALPRIWENKADFEARWAKLGKDATAAAASITDEASFKATMPGVFGNCGACHKEYRKPS